jgi:hypothetical protein
VVRSGRKILVHGRAVACQARSVRTRTLFGLPASAALPRQRTMVPVQATLRGRWGGSAHVAATRATMAFVGTASAWQSSRTARITRRRSCAAAQIGPDPGHRYVAEALVGSRRPQSVKGIVGEMALPRTATRAGHPLGREGEVSTQALVGGCQGRGPCSISTVAGVQPGFPSADSRASRSRRLLAVHWEARWRVDRRHECALTNTKGCPGALHRLASRGGPGCELWSQLIALFTSSLILFSSVPVHDVSANSTGHMAPSSRFALSLKPSVAYLVLNFSAGLK